MPASICPRCKHVNPEYAIYCHFDGVVLKAQQDALNLRLPTEFAFPSGRRCRTFDELAQGCQEEWAAARELLMRGTFAQFFRQANRADLVRAANDAKAQANPDIALTTFLGSLPGTRTQTPKLDLHPRRIMLGVVLVGETKTAPLTLTNRGQGLLQGTISITEGQDWLSLSETGKKQQLEVATAREQVIKLTANTKGVAAGQTYGAKLTVVTNGGVVEVPLRIDVAAVPFSRSPFQGIRSQRELAEKIRLQPKAAVPILESGDVERWFALNGWTYPVQGPQVKGVGGVQQFFEGMGVSKPPTVRLSQSEFRFTAKHRDTIKAQITLQTDVRKWVYAQVTSDSPWLKPTSPQIAGPQQATVPFEVDTNLWNLGPTGEGKLTLRCNGGQTLTLKVVVEVLGLPANQIARPAVPPTAAFAPSAVAAGPPPATHAPRSTSSVDYAPTRLKYVPAAMTMILLCLLFRLAMIPLADFWGRPSAAHAAAEKLGVSPEPGSPFMKWGGWLTLPWLPILGGFGETFDANVFQPDSPRQVLAREYRHYFTTYFVRWLVLRTWWLGALAGALLMLRRGESLDIPWGGIAGAIAGLGISATLAALFLVIETIPHTIWHLAVGAQSGFGALFMWSLLATICWLVIGVALGLAVPLVAPLRRLVLDPFQYGIASLFRLSQLSTLADYWSPD